MSSHLKKVQLSSLDEYSLTYIGTLNPCPIQCPTYPSGPTQSDNLDDAEQSDIQRMRKRSLDWCLWGHDRCQWTCDECDVFEPKNVLNAVNIIYWIGVARLSFTVTHNSRNSMGENQKNLKPASHWKGFVREITMHSDSCSDSTNCKHDESWRNKFHFSTISRAMNHILPQRIVKIFTLNVNCK